MGREAFIKSIANAFPIFLMSCFRFPNKTYVELDQIVARFWWGQKGGERHIYWKSWEYMSKSKQKGGMGFRCFEDFNTALLAKSARRLLTCDGHLWAEVVKGLYFSNSDFLNAKKGPRAYWGWSSILVERDFLNEKLWWRVGDGNQIKVWQDRWVWGSFDGRLKVGFDDENELVRLVSDLIISNTWNIVFRLWQRRKIEI